MKREVSKIKIAVFFIFIITNLIEIGKLSKEFNQKFADSLTRLIDSGGKSDYFEAGMHPLLEKTDVYYCDVSDLPCLEIDFIEDLNEARSLF